jgi:ABC-2 type transport system ATP-binding protein
MLGDNFKANDVVIAIRGVTRKFGANIALDNVTIAVPRGTVFGLVGVNGAGKTTLLKHVLGLLRPQSGSIRVLGRDPVLDPVAVLSKIGYLSEENNLPGWMRVSELIRYTRAFYPTWDDAYAEHLRQTFELDPANKIKNLSKGQRARAGLLVALAYQPEILVLDEPSSGLDPIVRRDILAAIIRTISSEGRTVLFSSHLLDEVERVSDHIAMIHNGKVAICSGMDDLRATFHRLTLRYGQSQEQQPLIPGALNWQGEGREWTAVCQGQISAIKAAAAEAGASIVNLRTASLDEIFVARVGSPIDVKES